MSASAAQKKAGIEADSVRRSQLANSIVGGQAQVSRQQEQIRHVSEENEQLKKEISAVSGKHYDYVKADKLATLQGEVDALERRYQFERMRKNDLTKRYQLARIDLLHSRKVKGGVNVEKEQAEAVQRQVDILESRLDQALSRFNDALSYNKELRDQIDIIREERRVFQRVVKKMEDDLCAKKRTMAERIEQSNRDMDERDEYQRQGEQLRQTIAEQEQEYNEQLRELDQAMEEIKTMREEQTNLQLELEAREYEFEGKLADNANATAGGNANPNVSQTSSTAASGGARRAGASGRGVDEQSDDGSSADATTKVLNVEKEACTITDIISQIREAVYEDDLHAVCAEFIRSGDSNFSLYKHINELTVAKEALRDEIRDLKLLITEEGENESQQRRLIKSLEDKLASTESQLQMIDSTLGQQRDALRLTLSTTEDVYTHIGCPSVAQDGSDEEEAVCTEANLMSYLGVIEERSTHILCAFQRHHQLQARGIDPATVQQRLSPSRSKETTLQQHMDDEEDNALTVNTDSPRGELPPTLSADELDLDVGPLLPTAPQTAHNAVSAQRLVKMADLPSASLAATETSAWIGELDDDKVVSHEDVRKQMELRLLHKREVEERALRKKKELKEMLLSPSGKGTVSPTRR